MSKKRYPEIKGVEIVWEFPKGYRWLGICHKETEKTGLYSYFGWQLWIPKSRTVQVGIGGAYACPAAMIESAKEFLFGRAHRRALGDPLGPATHPVQKSATDQYAAPTP